MLITFWIV